MNAINFDREITSENITWLIEQINFYESPINIYLKSDGGDPTCVQPLIHYINEIQEHKNIRLIGYGCVCSAAFDIIWQVQCPKSLIQGTWALVHKTRLSTDTSEERNKMFLEQKRVVEEQDDALYQFLKDSRVVPANDLKNFSQYKDVIIGYDKLVKLLSIHDS